MENGGRVREGKKFTQTPGVCLVTKRCWLPLIFRVCVECVYRIMRPDCFAGHLQSFTVYEVPVFVYCIVQGPPSKLFIDLIYQ